MVSATALSWRKAKARSMAAAKRRSDSARGPRMPISPSKRSTATCGGGLRTRSIGTSWRRSSLRLIEQQDGPEPAANASGLPCAPWMLKCERRTLAEDRIRRGRVAAVRLVQHQAGGKTGGRRHAFPRAYDDPLRRLVLARP